MDAQQLLRRQAAAESDRSHLELTWDEVLKYLSPKDRIIYQDRATMPTGENKREFIYDSVPEYAAKQAATILDGYHTPRDQKWHGLRASDPELMKIGNVARWFEQTRDALFKMRYGSKANFAAQNHEALHMLVMLGNGPMFIDEMVGQGIRYRSQHIYDIYLFENQFGIIDTIHRKFTLTAENAVREFGADKVSQKINENAATKPDIKHEFLHVVMPNSKQDKESFGPDRFLYSSVYIETENKEIVQEGGYTTFPYMVYRDTTAPREVYARGLGSIALADTKMLNVMNKTDIRASQKLVDPPLLTADSVSLVRTKPGANNIGGLSASGQQLVQPLQTNARPDVGEAKMEQRRMSIKDTFMTNMFQLLIDGPEKTATQVLEETREKGILLTPLLGRLQSEGTSVLIERELDIASRAGLLPEPPQELIEAGGEYEIQYDSPLSRAQKAEEAVGVQRQIQYEVSISGDPSTLDLYYDMDQARRIIAEANGVPAMVMLDEAEVQQRQQARQQAQALMQAAQAAPGLAKAGKDVAQAEQIASGA